MQLRWYFCAATLIAATAVSPSHAESISEALATAYKANPSLNIQRAQTRSVDEGVALSKTPFRPQVFLSANAGVNRSVSNTALGTSAETFTPFGFGITVDQNLFRGFRTINSVKAAEANVLASRETLRKVEQDVLFNASTAYSDVILAQEILAIRKQNLSFLQEQVRSSRARLEVGEGTRTDLAQSEGQLALAQAELATANANLQAARAVYRQIIGKNPGKLNSPRPVLRLYPHSLEQAISIGAVEHPAIRMTQHIVDLAAFNVKTAEGEFLPTLSLRGSANRDFNNGVQGNDSASAAATLNLSVPLYQGGGASATVRQNKEILGQRRIEVDQVRDQVRNDIVASWTTLVTARANIRSNQAQVRAARIAVEGVTEERNVGQRTQLDVLQTQSTLLNAQLALVQAKRNRIVAGYGLLSSVGRLDAKRLRLKVARYEPKEHYEKTVDRWFGLRTPSGR